MLPLYCYYLYCYFFLLQDLNLYLSNKYNFILMYPQEETLLKTSLMSKHN